MKPLLLALLFLLLFSCDNQKKKGASYKYKNLISYNRMIWLGDNLGCKKERKAIAKSILAKKANW